MGNKLIQPTGNNTFSFSVSGLWPDELDDTFFILK